MKSEKLDHLLIFSIIIIIVIIILHKKKNKENYTGMTPNKNHIPNNFNLLNIIPINDNNYKLDFGFSQPKPHFIGNQVEYYELLIGLYNNNKLVKTVSHRFKKDELKDKTPDGLTKIIGYIPIIIDKDNNKLYDQFKAGLRAIYPNSIMSKIVRTKNVDRSGFTFNKQENDYLLELGREFRNQINLETESASVSEDKVCKDDIEFQKSKEILGDYPNNLFLDNEDDLSDLVKNTYNRADFNVKINDNVINKLFTFS